MRFLISLLLVCATAGAASARNVYLNGVKLDTNVTIQAQTFVGCDVRFDDKGDIYITAKGYKVGVAAAPAGSPAAPGPAPGSARSFWLVSKQTTRGAVQYDVDVFINDTYVKKIRSVDDPTVLDVSRYVVAGGTNRVRMVAVKNLGERRVSSSPTDTLEILVGEGTAGGGTVTVDRVHATFRRNAGEMQNIQEDFEFRASP